MRIGVFGGTFDPIHSAHVAMVESAAAKYQLARVLFLPARLSPLKTDAPTDARHRVAMLALAISGRPDWSIAFEDLDREGPSYTVDTLRQLADRFRADELRLLMGTDTLAGFGRWKQPDEILRLARIAAFHRAPYWGDGLVIPPVAGISDRLDVFDAGSVRIASTEIRDDLARGVTPAGRVPAAVAEYITKQGLYRAEGIGR